MHVPRSWTEGTARCQIAGIPDTVSFVTKPAPAARMIGRALDAGVPASWVVGDEICLPRRRPRRRTRSPSLAGRADAAHLQRDSGPVQRACRPARPRHDPPAPLVPSATPPPGPNPDQPLPATSRSGMKLES
ncbi:transposase [Streptomyces sp. NPDC127097]|uniref:transposase n=1 Tax=Streptomyces sp. NPDC127097 TaxID=3347136 RepID=UPI0036568BF2